MAQQRMALWAAEEIDEDLQDVDLSLAIGNYGQNGLYDDGEFLLGIPIFANHNRSSL